MMIRTGRGWRTWLAAWFLGVVPLAGCSGAEVAAEPRVEGPKVVKIAPPGVIKLAGPEVEAGSLPALRVGAQYEGEWAPGGGYGLIALPDVNIREEVKQMWVHKVRRFLPGNTAEEFVAFARGMGLAGKLEKNGLGGPAQFGIKGDVADWYPRLGMLSYSAHDILGPECLVEEKRKWNAKIDQHKADELGKEWLKERGILPGNLDVAGRRIATTIRDAPEGEPLRQSYQVQYRGRVENFPCKGPGCAIEFLVRYDGEMVSMHYAWTETERLGVVECRTRAEAIEAFNRGEAGQLPKDLWGGEVWTGDPTIYYAEGSGAKVLQPCYCVAVKKGERCETYYVPMAKSKYFMDPKKQVEVLKEVR